MATLQITKKPYVIPLIDVQSTTFAERYVTGVRLRLFGWREHGEVEAQGPLPAYYLIDNPKRCAQIDRSDGCHEESLRKDIGFFLGLLHGGVLTPDGTLRPDAKTLVLLHTQDFREEYECGRWDYFTALQGDCLHGQRSAGPGGEQSTLRWAIGCTVGEHSGRLFPLAKPQLCTHPALSAKQHTVLQEA